MSRIDQLRKNYQRICGLPWDRNVAGAQRVWLAVYDKDDERKLRLRLGLFKEATEHVGHQWNAVDFTNAFADWLCSPPYSDYAESYFESPTRFGTAPMAALKKAVAAQLTHTLQTVQPAEDTVVAVYGVASLFGFLRRVSFRVRLETGTGTLPAESFSSETRSRACLAGWIGCRGGGRARRRSAARR